MVDAIKSRLAFEPSSAKAPETSSEQDGDPLFPRTDGAFRFDTSPEHAIPITGSVYYEADQKDPRVEWLAWEAEVTFYNPDSAVKVSVSRECKYKAGQSVAEASFDINVRSVDEAEFLGHLLLAAVEKLRRTADLHAVSLRYEPETVSAEELAS